MMMIMIIHYITTISTTTTTTTAVGDTDLHTLWHKSLQDNVFYLTSLLIEIMNWLLAGVRALGA
jgi:hypothetical protein